MFDHALHHSVLLSLIHIYSHTHSVTTTLTKKENSLPSKCKQNLNITGTLSSPLEDRRKKHSSSFQIYNYSSLKRDKMEAE